MNKGKECREEDTISFFCRNCTDKGNLNAIKHRHISHFADLAAIVQKYCAMESAWKNQATFWDPLALTKPLVRTKRVYPRKTPNPITKKPKPTTGLRTVLEGWLNRPCKIHTTPDTVPTHSLRACWILCHSWLTIKTTTAMTKSELCHSWLPQQISNKSRN